MSDSKLEVYLHFVWATKYREPLLDEAVEVEAHKVIYNEVKRLRCEVLAIGGMPDHVHVLLRFGRRVEIGKLVNQMKGVSSAFLNDRLFPNRERYFRWQPGYGAFSVSNSHLDAVTSYIHNQKARHTTGKLWTSLEQITDDTDGDTSQGIAEEFAYYTTITEPTIE